MLLGLNAKWKVNQHNTVYGQVMLDEFIISEVRAGNGWWGNKQGIQFGLKSSDLMGVKSLNFHTFLNLIQLIDSKPINRFIPVVLICFSMGWYIN